MQYHFTVSCKLSDFLANIQAKTKDFESDLLGKQDFHILYAHGTPSGVERNYVFTSEDITSENVFLPLLINSTKINSSQTDALLVRMIFHCHTLR